MFLQGPFWNPPVSMLQEDGDLDGWVEGLEASWEGGCNGGGPSWRKQKVPPTSSPKSPLSGSTLTFHHAREESCLLASVSGSAQSQHGCIWAEAEEK